MKPIQRRTVKLLQALQGLAEPFGAAEAAPRWGVTRQRAVGYLNRWGNRCGLLQVVVPSVGSGFYRTAPTYRFTSRAAEILREFEQRTAARAASVAAYDRPPLSPWEQAYWSFRDSLNLPTPAGLHDEP